MLTSLDWLIIVFMAFTAFALLSLCLMFFLKNTVARRVCLYVSSAFAVYVSTVAFRIGIGALFTGQIVFSCITALLAVAAVVVERVFKNKPKTLLIARIMSASAMVLALINAIS